VNCLSCGRRLLKVASRQITVTRAIQGHSEKVAVDVNDIDWVHAAGRSYSALECGARTDLIERSILSILHEFPDVFLPLSRFAILNRSVKIQSIKRSKESRFVVIRGGIELQVSRRNWPIVKSNYFK
jgi:DNA-binding LytR/AlgR family response regulator